VPPLRFRSTYGDTDTEMKCVLAVNKINMYWLATNHLSDRGFATNQRVVVRGRAVLEGAVCI